MSDYLERLILKRKGDISYLRRAHEGSVHWLNLAKLTRKQICEHDKKNLRIKSARWFLLGLSIGRLLEQPNGKALLLSMLQLIQEYDYFINYASRSRKFPTFKWYPPIVGADESESKNNSDPAKAHLHKVGRKVIFLDFMAFSVNVPLDYCEVVFSMCEVLSLVYNKILAQAHSKDSQEAVVKFDTWIKSTVLAEMSRHLSEVATPSIDSLFGGISDTISPKVIQIVEETKQKKEEDKKENGNEIKKADESKKDQKEEKEDVDKAASKPKEIPKAESVRSKEDTETKGEIEDKGKSEDKAEDDCKKVEKECIEEQEEEQKETAKIGTQESKTETEEKEKKSEVNDLTEKGTQGQQSSDE